MWGQRLHTHSRISFVSVLPCEVFSSPCYTRMSSVLWVHSNALILLLRALGALCLPVQKSKCFCQDCPPSPTYSFVYHCLHLSLALWFSPPLELCVFFPPSCAVFLLIVQGRTPRWFPPETGEHRSCVFPPPRTFLSQDTRHQRNPICLISPPALQSAPMIKIGFTARFAPSEFVFKLQNALLQARYLGTQAWNNHQPLRWIFRDA